MNVHGAVDRPGSPRTNLLGGFFSLAAIALRVLINFIKIPNFSPLGGLGVAQGAQAPLGVACLWSLVAVAGSDLALWMLRGFPSDHFLFAPFVYPGFLAYACLGWFLARQGTAHRLAMASVLGSLQFYLVTNFGAWMLYTDRYAPDWSGLLHSYVAGLPFYGLTLGGDLIFTAVFIGLFGVLSARPKPVTGDNPA